ncbi:hypothetical protein Rctr85_063 [Virus Rctr85]|nr:hypothetical protein Rctr85_063 [Virus Rctr85]
MNNRTPATSGAFAALCQYILDPLLPLDVRVALTLSLSVSFFDTMPLFPEYREIGLDELKKIFQRPSGSWISDDAQQIIFRRDVIAFFSDYIKDYTAESNIVEAMLKVLHGFGMGRHAGVIPNAHNTVRTELTELAFWLLRQHDSTLADHGQKLLMQLRNAAAARRVTGEKDSDWLEIAITEMRRVQRNLSDTPLESEE